MNAWTRRVPFALATVVAAALAAPAAAGPPRSRPSGSEVFEHPVGHRFDAVEDCLQATPATAHVRGITDDGRQVKLDVLVPLDMAEGADIALMLADPDQAEEGRARFDALAAKVHAVLDAAIETYAPLGVELRLRYDLLMPLVDGAPRQRTDDINALIALAKDQYRGRVPAGADAVYVATDLDVHSGGSRFVAGKADCIGGIRYMDRAFAAGEVELDESPITIGPTAMFQDITAKILAHELGHLLGAHHHYANCVEGIPTEPVADALSLCTLMINDVGLASLNFSAPNGLIVRGHGVDYASGNDG